MVRSLRILSWNIAAVNNNPFEYFIHYPISNEYDRLMQDVETFVETPGDADVLVRDVFTDSMFAELKELMLAEGWSGLDATETYWVENLKERKIMTDFIKDKALGSKRLASMPDRVTNTINTLDQGTIHRPTVISCSRLDMTQMDSWWAAWKTFMFETQVQVTGKGGKVLHSKPCGLLPTIKKDKYPAVTEEEEAMSIPLQALCMGIFDAILVHMLNTLSPTGGWQQLKEAIIENIYSKKGARIMQLLSETYAETDVILLQEVQTELPKALRASSLGDIYHIIEPKAPSAVDQNSVIMLRKDAFEVSGDLTADAMAAVEKQGAISDGDLIVAAATGVDGRSFVFASFHGDTDGLCTEHALKAVHTVTAATPGLILVVGIDANCYENPTPGKQLGAEDFGLLFRELGWSSCWGDVASVSNYTTYCARTFLQPQLQKASRMADKAKNGDINPKDYILFSKGSLKLDGKATKDNTGNKEYLEGVVFPSLSFPSDHAIVSCTLDLIE
ncbi:hypothetical protein AB1Y20_021290 [Prymnesium parvum]|uniref:Endonuclease/exonuclease/phosphatase domain-containing protein n=1 Tax=Prymnesium parvum TaxID=97485 RepID=A0AB34JLM5_PRYPA|mmetsp:Transcript_49081/g.121847  ORF Transcript_49081/g.121847 Transcript_49081/m.121847 type:complete len:503 (-) Transcript_49081:490-1998(-)|eukprot:CAMPEP_0113244682 /NCGR_PEP_ID=MMETSP0008_2-20120614/8537_1 /TAXON_ID=97485 /ORGANISM="Prymnesium parvum" /LENGTH=502 /DNA_ID=CAMNT_0000092327 /DNA_START=23 /DNA_END=1531 /DNA_ORIENTATION=- /assembly_acc=CAM_ASM_000153